MKRLKYLIILTQFIIHANNANFQKFTYTPSNEFPPQQELIKTGLSWLEIEQTKNWITSYQNQYVVSEWQYYYSILPRIINELNLKVGCEVGVALGTHCAAILANTNIQKIYAVDPYLPGFPGCPLKNIHKAFDILFLTVKHRLSAFADRTVMMRTLSIDAAKEFKDNELDFVFIDAIHDYPNLTQDLNAWYNKVRSGGIVSGDDYTDRFPGVKQAVNEFFGKRNIKVTIEQSRVWWAIKP